jgi:hypothetical protein
MDDTEAVPWEFLKTSEKEKVFNAPKFHGVRQNKFQKKGKISPPKTHASTPVSNHKNAPNQPRYTYKQ